MLTNNSRLYLCFAACLHVCAKDLRCPSFLYSKRIFNCLRVCLMFLKNSVSDLDFPSFVEARAYVRSLELKDHAAWRSWARSEERPRYIPRTPRRIYADHWAGYDDWLGTAENDLRTLDTPSRWRRATSSRKQRNSKQANAGQFSHSPFEGWAEASATSTFGNLKIRSSLSIHGPPAPSDEGKTNKKRSRKHKKRRSTKRSSRHKHKSKKDPVPEAVSLGKRRRAIVRRAKETRLESATKIVVDTLLVGRVQAHLFSELDSAILEALDHDKQSNEPEDRISVDILTAAQKTQQNVRAVLDVKRDTENAVKLLKQAKSEGTEETLENAIKTATAINHRIDSHSQVQLLKQYAVSNVMIMESVSILDQIRRRAQKQAEEARRKQEEEEEARRKQEEEEEARRKQEEEAARKKRLDDVMVLVQTAVAVTANTDDELSSAIKTLAQALQELTAAISAMPTSQENPEVEQITASARSRLQELKASADKVALRREEITKLIAGLDQRLREDLARSRASGSVADIQKAVAANEQELVPLKAEWVELTAATMPKLAAVEEAHAAVTEIQNGRRMLCAKLSSEMRNHASGHKSPEKSWVVADRLLQLLGSAQSIGLRFSATDPADDAFSQVLADAWALVQELRDSVSEAYAAARTALSTAVDSARAAIVDPSSSSVNSLDHAVEVARGSLVGRFASALGNKGAVTAETENMTADEAALARCLRADQTSMAESAAALQDADELLAELKKEEERRWAKLMEAQNTLKAFNKEQSALLQTRCKHSEEDAGDVQSCSMEQVEEWEQEVRTAMATAKAAGVGSKSSAWLEAQELADKISKLVQVLVDVEDAMDECEVKGIV